MEFKHDYIVNGGPKIGTLRVSAAERPLLRFEILCPGCGQVLQQDLEHFIRTGELFNPEGWFWDHLPCSADITEEMHQAAKVHLATLEVSHPNLAERIKRLLECGGLEDPSDIRT